MMNVPNLIIIGAQKSGTTWLHRALEKHEQFFMTKRKELNFFNHCANHEDDNAMEKYLANFDFTGNHQYVGESTPHYMWIKKNCPPFDPEHAPRTSAEFIKRVTPDAKLVMVLRNPVTRAISAFHHHFAMGRLSSHSMIDKVDANLGLYDIGHYARHIPYWQEIFGENLHVYLYDDLERDSILFLSNIFNDLDVDDKSDELGNLFATRKINNRQSILTHKKKQQSTDFPSVSRDQIQDMIKIFDDDISYVETLLSRDLSHWRDLDSIEQSTKRQLTPQRQD